MNVSLTPELEKFIDDRVASGRYRSASEVVRESLRLLQEREEEREAKLTALRAAIDEGIASLERGEGISGEEALAYLRNRGRRERQAVMKRDRPIYRDRIITDPDILVGKPIIKGTRISVEVILEQLADTPDLNELFAAYPDLTLDDVKAALAYAGELAGGDEVTPAPRRRPHRDAHPSSV